MRTSTFLLVATSCVASQALATVTNNLVADSYVVTSGSGASARQYSVMDVYIECTNAADIVSSVFGVNAYQSSFSLNNGKTFKHSSGTTSAAWLPAAGQTAWDSFLTTGCRDQDAAATALNLQIDPNWATASSGGAIIGQNGGAGWFPGVGASTSSNPYCRAGFYNGQTGPINTAKASTAIAGNGITPGQRLDNLFMIGRFTIDVTGEGIGVMNTLSIRFAVAGKHNGTTTFTGSTGSIGRYDDILVFAVPAPGAVACVGLGAWLVRRRR